MISLELLPKIPSPLSETGGASLEWPRLREHLAGATVSPLGRAWLLALEPSGDLGWIEQQQQRTAELRIMISAGGSFDFHGVFDPTALLKEARVDGVALDSLNILRLLGLAERVVAWTNLIALSKGTGRYTWPGIAELSEPMLGTDLSQLLRSLRGKIEPDGSLSDDASSELSRIRRAMERQHRTIEESLRRTARRLRDEGATHDDVITVRGERFVIPVRAEFKRRVHGVVHGSSSTGQTVFVEPLETIEQNNELVRLLDEEQAEIHRILIALTRLIAEEATAIHVGTCVLAEAEAHYARARFAIQLDCVQPNFFPAHDAGSTSELRLLKARHPLLEIRMRAASAMDGGGKAVGEARPVPLTILLPAGSRQLIISGPNTGGKTVSLKTLGLLSLMAQAGVPIPAEEAMLPLFGGVYADIGDAQSIERNLSSFSSHVVNVDRISRSADRSSLVLLDELGSATDPEEGAALAVAVADHFLRTGSWCCVTTHLTSLKVYAANHAGVLNAAVGFDRETLTPTYELRLGVPGASAGLNIAERLGLAPAIIAEARGQMTTQTADIGEFLDQLHDQLAAAKTERDDLRRREQELARERARLELEGRNEQKQRTRELEGKLNLLLEDFTAQLKETVKSIEDKTISQKIARDSATRVARLKREFSEQFNSTIVAHVSGADKTDEGRRGRGEAEVRVGDLVRLRSLGREARVSRVLDGKSFEVAIGQMKMRVPRSDIGEVTPVQAISSAEARKGRGGVTVASTAEGDYVPMELNVIGRTADEAEGEVERYIDQAFLAGLPRVRIVHGTGMGVLRRTLREYLKKHPHVTGVTEPPHYEGGQGATVVELRQ